jgi:hypothetical protein
MAAVKVYRGVKKIPQNAFLFDCGHIAFLLASSLSQVGIAGTMPSIPQLLLYRPFMCLRYYIQSSKKLHARQHSLRDN